MMITGKSNLINAFMLCLAVMFMAGCSKEEGVKELKLSTMESTVQTDSIAYAFDIVSGNGGYQVEVNTDNKEEPVAKATVSGNHVSVDLLKPYTRLTVADAAGQAVQLTIESTNRTLQVESQMVMVSYGSYLRSKLSWGNGGYYVLKHSQDDCAEVTFERDGSFMVKAVHPGTMHLVVSDSRGTTNELDVSVGPGCDITGSSLTYSLTRQEASYGPYTFPIKYGVGEWKIVSSPEALHTPFNLVVPKDKVREQDFLQVYIPKDTVGTLPIMLEDKAGNKVTVTIEIK